MPMLDFLREYIEAVEQVKEENENENIRKQIEANRRTTRRARR